MERINMPCTALFTIVSPSYLPQALTLIESINASNSDANSGINCQIFVLGACSKLDVSLPSNTILVYVEDFLPANMVQKIVMQYTIEESCWALKPCIAEKLLDNFQQVFYVDSDICFFGSTATLIDELANFDILLTPHYLTFFPQDKLSPNDLTLLRGGVFNAGFFGVRQSEEGRTFLQWWSHRVSEFGRNDPDNGMNGDQKWLDLAPVLFPNTKICRHLGFNVAYWNLYERQFSHQEGGGRSVVMLT